MANDSRISELPHRLFREPRFVANRLPEALEQDDLARSISQSIALVEQAAEVVDGMKETIRVHEDTIFHQNNELAQLSRQKEDDFEKLLQLEEICRRETERAAKADAQNAAMIERVKTLELRNTNLTAQLDRMVQAVSKSFAKRADQEIFSPPLRSVS